MIINTLICFDWLSQADIGKIKEGVRHSLMFHARSILAAYQVAVVTLAENGMGPWFPMWEIPHNDKDIRLMFENHVEKENVIEPNMFPDESWYETSKSGKWIGWVDEKENDGFYRTFSHKHDRDTSALDESAPQQK